MEKVDCIGRYKVIFPLKMSSVNLRESDINTLELYVVLVRVQAILLEKRFKPAKKKIINSIKRIIMANIILLSIP